MGKSERKTWLGRYRKGFFLLLGFVLLLQNVFLCYAAQPGQVLAKGSSEKELVLYIQNPGEIRSISALVGTAACEEVSVTPAAEDPCMKTLLLVDNSASIPRAYHAKIAEILTALVENRSANEQFSLATFSSEIQYLVEDSTDDAALKEAISGIHYQNQDNYLIPVLYQLFSAWRDSGEVLYRKIVIFSDGASEEGIGYTMAELQRLIGADPYPVYVFACDNGRASQKAELENLLSISRATNGEQFLMSGLESSSQAVSAVANGSDVLKVTIQPPAQLLDGTEKGVQLRMETGSGTLSSDTSMRMPFAEMERQTEASTPTARPTPVVTETESMEAEEEEPVSFFSTLLFKILVGAAIALAAIACLIVFLVRRQKARAFKAAPPGARPDPVSGGGMPGGAGLPPAWGGDAATRTMGFSSTQREDDNTVDVWGSRGRRLILENRRNPLMRFDIALQGPLLVGRSQKGDCQIVIDDGTVSRNHCEIYERNGEVFVRDLQSKNGCFLDGAEFKGEAMLRNGCELKLGEVPFWVGLQ